MRDSHSSSILRVIVAGLNALIFGILSWFRNWGATQISRTFIFATWWAFFVCSGRRMVVNVNNTGASLPLCCSNKTASVVISSESAHFRAATPFAFFILNIFVIFFGGFWHLRSLLVVYSKYLFYVARCFLWRFEVVGQSRLDDVQCFLRRWNGTHCALVSCSRTTTPNFPPCNF